jgi:RHS repeat-associated protein
MSDLGAIVKTTAEDMAEGGEKAGKAIAEHFTGIGKELENSVTRYRGAESDVEHSLTSITEDGAQSAKRATGSVGEATARSVDATAADVSAHAGSETRSLAADSEQEAEFTGREQGSGGSSDDPIDLVTGEMYLPQVDLRLDGIVPLVFERRHGSFYRRGRWFGVRWASTLDQRVEVDDDGVHYAAPDGRILHYPIPTVHGQKVMASHGPRWPLTWNRTDDVIEIEQGDLGCTLVFRPGPTPQVRRSLSAVVDRGGNRITFVYDADGVPTDVYHSGGYHVIVESVETRGGVRVSGLRLADPAGGPDVPVRAFRYDLAGRLTAVVNGSGLEQSFEYDREDRITRWVDRNGFDYRYRYREDGRVARGEGSDGFLAVDLGYDLAARVTTRTDALGNTESYHWNERLQTVKVVDALGGVTHTRRARFGDEVEVTDQLGRTTAIERDAFGDVLAVRRPDGTALTTAYDGQRRPTTVTDPDGAVWHYAYDPVSGHLAAVTDPMGAVVSYARDGQGRITAITDPLGRVTQVACDRAGLPIQIIDPDGASYAYRRDAFGRVVEIIDPSGAVTRFERNIDGDLLSQTLADGVVERWARDAEGNLIEHIDIDNAVTRYEYGPFDVVTARTDPDGARYAFDYDPQLRLTAATAPTGVQWTYAYDAAGRTVAEADFNGAAMVYAFDAAGQLTSRTNALGQVLGLDYDVMGRVVGRSVDGVPYRYAYDAAGRLVSAEGPGTRLTQAYDPAGRVLAESLGEHAITSTYDIAGQRTSRTTPSGAATFWSYNSGGNPTEMRTGSGLLLFEHDALGRETTRRLGPSASITTAYDVLGRVTGQAVWTADAPSASGWRVVSARSYAYRADNTPLAISDQLRGTRGYELDPAGRVTTVSGSNWRESYAYDSLGNLTTADYGTPDATASGTREVAGTTIRSAGRTRYEYDAAGRLVLRARRTLSGTRLEWHFAWDADDHLTQVTTPDGHTWRYTYDPLGRRTGKAHTDTAGRTVETFAFVWEGSRLAEQTATGPDGTVSTITWDYTPGTYTPIAQTQRDRAADAPQEEIDAAFHAIVTDLIGTPMELVDPDGAIVWQASTTLWGQALSGSPACPLSFPGQYRDQETGLHYNLNRYYDPETAAYASPDPLGLTPAPNPHRYVGNPLAWIDPLGLAAYKVVAENDAGRFGDLNPGTPGDNLEAHHMPQDGLGHLARNDGGAIVMKAEDHALTRTYKSLGRATKKAEASLPFRTVLARDIADVRRIGQQKYGDPSYFNPGIKKLLAYYRSIGKI